MTNTANTPWNITISPPEHLKYEKVMGRVMGNDGQIVATCEYGTYGYGKETVEANSRLIAAAPELLAALQELLLSGDEWKATDRFHTARIKARIAIDKINNH